MSENAARSTDVPIVNVPNVLTSIRLLLAIVVFCLIPLKLYVAGLVLFVVAASTDWVDGWYARRYQQVTKLGRILDPFVDKIIICGSFIMLAVEMRELSDAWPWFSRITGWIAVLVVGREMLVTALRGFIEQHGGDFSAMMSGKLKMVFQCAAVITSLLALRQEPNATPPVWLLWSLVAAIWLSVFSTVYSGVGYIFAAVKMVRN
ncbi:MAG: CDP-diacylglycerol--glycerol-3-phosphate 3-phosphatidyltransferase [Planctomycetaceae bacterium]|nr:CDP-diacylglycerol--glycerol-3-phosphate 3-phosphatidyltransferase [Planctomycetaceae bacterium]